MSGDTLLTLDQYFDLPDQPGVSHELVNGRLIEMARPSVEHNQIAFRCAHLLANICETRFPHLIISGDNEFRLNQESVQAPDVLLLDRRKRAAAESYRGALRCAPDLAVEIVSPSESSEDLDEKVANYLAAGTKTVWVIWHRRRRHALAYHRDGSVQNVPESGFLEAPEVLPGVRLPLSSILIP